MVPEREATVTSKGQITIPKAVRDSLGLRAGDKLTIVEEQPGIVTMRRRRREDNPLRQWRGYLKDMKGVDVDEYVRDLRGH